MKVQSHDVVKRKRQLPQVGHKIIIAAYHVIKNKQEYQEPVLHDNPRKHKKKVKYYVGKLKELGIDINEIDQIRGRFFTDTVKEFEHEIDPIRANRVFV